MKLSWVLCAMSALALVGCAADDRSDQSGNTSINIQQCETDDCDLTSDIYEQWIDSNSPNTAQLNLFFNQMPKGADLHNHFSGSIYVETYLDWLDKKGYYIDSKTLKVVSPKDKTSSSITVDKLRASDNLYRQLLALWSNKDFNNHYHFQQPPDKAFFDTFGYFGASASQNWHDGLQILKNRAIKENVSYLEVMLTSFGYPVEKTNDQERLSKIDSQLESINNRDALSSANQYKEELLLYNHLYDYLVSNKTFKNTIDQKINLIDTAAQGIDDTNFTMRYQTYVSRNKHPSIVFSDLYAAFEAAKQDPLIVGVNIVGPENGVTALRDYSIHMNMFKFFRMKYPNVHVSMHAGELTLGMVRPKNLTFHISEAIDIAGTERIGHGVDISYESSVLADLRVMKNKPVPVEICLTSNEFILGVKGNAHPYRIYSEYGVPLVIATDDSGVSRDNLSREYLMLATRYHPSYEQIKGYVYNSIRYSFLPDKKKQQEVADLNRRFAKFEANMVAYSDRM